MARLSQQADLADQIIKELQQWYYAGTQIPAAFAKADPRVIVAAFEISGGDWRRCSTEDGKAITVWNYRVW